MHIFFVVFCIALGLFSLLFPNQAWYLKSGWKYKNSEPSDAALVLTRVGGAIAIVIGIVVFFNPDFFAG